MALKKPTYIFPFDDALIVSVVLPFKMTPDFLCKEAMIGAAFRSYAESARELRKQHNVKVSAIQIALLLTMPEDSSGKTRRQELRMQKQHWRRIRWTIQAGLQWKIMSSIRLLMGRWFTSVTN